MWPTEALEIHFALWSTKKPDHITHRGVQHPVVRLDKNTKKFAFVEIGRLRLVTQNLGKPSDNTNWCLTTENGKMTWIFKDNRYTGKVVSYTKNGTFVNQVFTLNPEEKIFEATV